MRVVIALDGNALLHRGQPLEAEIQRRNIGRAAAIAAMAGAHTVIVTHGNGPQVGLLALQAEAYPRRRPYPLDILGAETEGMIGYLLEQERRNHLPSREVVTLLTQVEVAADDLAFTHPTKPIGPTYSRADGERLAAERDWTIAPDGDAWRRVVPSPEPRRILELAALRLLVPVGALVVCAGGGSIPVGVTPAGGIHGVEAVIDKDLAADMLARELEVEALLLLTDVAAVYLDWGRPSARPLHRVTPSQLRRYAFTPGSMGPKVEAACRFVEATGGSAAIGRLEAAAALLGGIEGTIIRADWAP